MTAEPRDRIPMFRDALEVFRDLGLQTSVLMAAGLASLGFNYKELDEDELALDALQSSVATARAVRLERGNLPLLEGFEKPLGLPSIKRPPTIQYLIETCLLQQFEILSEGDDVVGAATTAVDFAKEVGSPTGTHAAVALTGFMVDRGWYGDLKRAAVYLERAGRDEEALPVLETITTVYHDLLYQSPRKLLALSQRHAQVLRRLGRFQQAEQVLMGPYFHFVSTLGDQDNRTAAQVWVIADLYDAWGKPAKAAEWRARLAEEEPESE